MLQSAILYKAERLRVSLEGLGAGGLPEAGSTGFSGITRRSGIFPRAEPR
jgi:hypothetical protein